MTVWWNHLPRGGRIAIVAGTTFVVIGVLIATNWNSISPSSARPARPTPIDQAQYLHDTPAPLDTPLLTVPATTPTPGPYSVEYEVLGPGEALVTYVIGPGFNEQQQIVALPWSLPIQSDKVPRTPIISAQLHSNGTVTCNIHQWGYNSDRIISTATSSGAYVIASCNPPS